MNPERKIRKCIRAINQNESSVELRAEHSECSENRECYLVSQSISTSDPLFEDSIILCFYCTRNRADLKRSSCIGRLIEGIGRLIEGIGGAHELVEKNANAEASAKQKEATLYEWR